ncbi:hypothetical protein BJ944DRAFT_244862 [Cunninghamella echinulata]|nr:hypothetical protein BJ944DRAFT_244862 [Cunninghamella echinulata]
MTVQLIHTNQRLDSLNYNTNNQVQQPDAIVKKEKKPLRKAVGIVVIDPNSQRVLMISSKKREGAYVLPRGDCNLETEESFEATALRVLKEKAYIQADGLSRRIGIYAEANKKGKTVGHHAMFEVTSFTVLTPPDGFDRERVWVEYNRALMATQERPMSHLALTSSSLRTLRH